jgi:nitrous oxide reductase accessory protein NosL
MLVFGVLQAKMYQTVSQDKAILLQKTKDKLYCPNCGMHLVKFYKTSHAIKLKNNNFLQYCSIHCLFEALYHINKNDIKKILVVANDTLKFIDVKKAYYVVGSKIKGTMTQNSKYAFKNKNKALQFIKKYGGKIVDFNNALEITKKDFENDNTLISKKRAKKYKKGQKIYDALCKKIDNFDRFKTIANLKAYIKNNHICSNIDEKKLQMVGLYLWFIKRNNVHLSTKETMYQNVKKHEKCPVCGMFVAKYPKWVAKIELSNKKHFYFDGVKDMMKYYFNPTKFKGHYKKELITKIYVTDYYTLKKIEAKKAYYVIGSNVYGPMGEELIPFETFDSAKEFKDSHYGKKIVTFDKIKTEFNFE